MHDVMKCWLIKLYRVSKSRNTPNKMTTTLTQYIIQSYCSRALYEEQNLEENVHPF